MATGRLHGGRRCTLLHGSHTLVSNGVPKPLCPPFPHAEEQTEDQRSAQVPLPSPPPQRVPLRVYPGPSGRRHSPSRRVVVRSLPSRLRGPRVLPSISNSNFGGSNTDAFADFFLIFLFFLCSGPVSSTGGVRCGGCLAGFPC